MFTSASFPLPKSPQASLPEAGSINSYPYFFNFSILSWTIGFSYILVFIAGAKITFALVAIIVVDNISSDIPFATFPIIFAVAGATKKTSALFASDICCISKALGSANISVTTIFWLNDWNDKGVTNLVADSVIITLTSMSFFFKALMMSKAL